MTLQLVQAGDPVLRKVARPMSVDEIRSASTKHLIKQMRDTMRAAPGVGLAAPQIGESIQLAVMEDRIDYIKDISSEQLAERQRSPVDFHVIINPKISIVGETTVDFFEGCLSVAGFAAVVRRGARVRVEMFERASRTNHNNCAGLVRTYLAARDRSSERNALHRPNADAFIYYH